MEWKWMKHKKGFQLQLKSKRFQLLAGKNNVGIVLIDSAPVFITSGKDIEDTKTQLIDYFKRIKQLMLEEQL